MKMLHQFCTVGLLIAALAAVVVDVSGEMLMHRMPLVIGRDFELKQKTPIACKPFGLDCLDFTLCDDTTILISGGGLSGAPMMAVSGHDNRTCPSELQVCCSPNPQIIDELLLRYEDEDEVPADHDYWRFV